MSDRAIRVHYEAEHEAPTFDEAGTPMLTYGRHPQYGWGWTLSYFEDGGGMGVDDHFIPGDLTSVDEAVASAQQWLNLVDESR